MAQLRRIFYCPINLAAALIRTPYCRHKIERDPRTPGCSWSAATGPGNA
jgi:hypothetical protein